MTTDAFTEQARAEAEERFPPPKESAVIYPLTAVRSHSRGAHIAGWEAARDYLARQEVTEAEAEAAARAWAESFIEGHPQREAWEPGGDISVRAASIERARAALSAARDLGRDAR